MQTCLQHTANNTWVRLVKPHERITYARELRGMTKQQLEEAASLSRGSLSRMEAGGRGIRTGGSAQVLQRISQALNVRLEWLVSGTEPIENTEAHEPLQNLHKAIAIAREGGVPESILELVKKENSLATTDQTIWWWIEEIRLRHALVQHENRAPESRSPITIPPNTEIRRVSKKSETG